MSAARPSPSAAPARLDLVAAFINTADLERETDEFDSPAALRAWLLQRRLLKPSDPVTANDLAEARRFRETLRRALVGNNGAAVDSRTRRELNQLASRKPMVVVFTDEAESRLEPSASGVDAAIARILATVFEAMLTGSWIRLKACANDACRWAFYDASKNRSARWCEMADCGNDAKGRAYRQRRRSQTLSRSMRRGA